MYQQTIHSSTKNNSEILLLLDLITGSRKADLIEGPEIPSDSSLFRKVVDGSEMRETFSTLLVAAVLLSVSAFSVSRMSSRIVRSRNMGLYMADYESQVLAAQPTIEEWLDVADPGLRRATLAMFRSVKEIAYKIRTASCDKMSCFNDFGNKCSRVQLHRNFSRAAVNFHSADGSIPANPRATNIWKHSVFR